MASTFENFIQDGLRASAADNTELAIQCFLEAAQVQPADGRPHFLIAGELAQVGRVEEAETAYARAVLLAPDMPIARYQLGLLQFATGRLPIALTTWQPLLALDESQCLRHFVRGFFAMAEDDKEQAQAHFRRGLALNVDNAPMNRDIEQVLSSLDTVQPDATVVPGAFAAPAGDQLQHGASPDEGEQSASESSAHVLLANYRPVGQPN